MRIALGTVLALSIFSSIYTYGAEPSQKLIKNANQSSGKLVNCSRKSPLILEDKAIAIAKAEILKKIGQKEFEGYSRYITDFNVKNDEWIVIAYPDSRVIDEDISVIMNRCGQIIRYKMGP